MIPAPLPREAPGCPFVPRFTGPRMGPTVTAVSYQLAVNGNEHLAAAVADVITWPTRVQRAAQLRDELHRLEQATSAEVEVSE